MTLGVYSQQDLLDISKSSDMHVYDGPTIKRGFSNVIKGASVCLCTYFSARLRGQEQVCGSCNAGCTWRLLISNIAFVRTEVRPY